MQNDVSLVMSNKKFVDDRLQFWNLRLIRKLEFEETRKGMYFPIK